MIQAARKPSELVVVVHPLVGYPLRAHEDRATSMARPTILVARRMLSTVEKTKDLLNLRRDISNGFTTITRLSQNIAVPLSGRAERPASGNTVSPPEATPER